MNEPETKPSPSSGSTPRGSMAPDAIARAEVERQAIRLRQAGRTFEEIATELGLPNKGVAHRYVQRGLSRWMRNTDAALRDRSSSGATRSMAEALAPGHG